MDEFIQFKIDENQYIGTSLQKNKLYDDIKAHQQRHIELHDCLMELICDYFKATGKKITKTKLSELISWSWNQTGKPISLTWTGGPITDKVCFING